MGEVILLISFFSVRSSNYIEIAYNSLLNGVLYTSLLGLTIKIAPRDKKNLIIEMCSPQNCQEIIV